MAAMRLRSFLISLLGIASIAGAQDVPRVLGSPVPGVAGPEFSDASGVEYSPAGDRILVTQGGSLSLVDGTTYQTIWNRQFSGNLQAGHTTNGAGIIVYNSLNGQVIELNPADGTLKRSLGTFGLTQTLRVGSGHFALFEIGAESETTTAFIYRLTDGALVRTWNDELRSGVSGERGFAGAGAAESFYVRRQRVNVATGAVTTFTAGTNSSLFLGSDELGNVAQAVTVSEGADFGKFLNLRVLRADGTTLDLPAPAADTTVSFAGFSLSGATRTVGVFSRRLVSGVPTAQLLRYNIATGALVNTQSFNPSVSGQYAGGHVPFGRKMAVSSGRFLTFRPDAFAGVTLGTFIPGTTLTGRLGEIVTSVGVVAPNVLGAVYSASTPLSGARRETLASVPRGNKSPAFQTLMPGSFATAAIPTIIDANPQGRVLAASSFGRTGAADSLRFFDFWTGANLGSVNGSFSSVAVLNEFDLFAQRGSGDKVDLYRRTAGSTTLTLVRTYDDAGNFPLAAGANKVAIVNFTDARKDLKLYDLNGNSTSIALTTKPIRLRIGTDNVMTLVSLGDVANQVRVHRFNVAGASIVGLGTQTINFPFSNAADIRAAISANSRVLALFAPNAGASTHFGQVRSTLQFVRLPDYATIATYTDFLPNALQGLEAAPDGALVYAALGQAAPAFTVPAWVDRLNAPTQLGGGDSTTLGVQLPFRAQQPVTVQLTTTGGGITVPPTVEIPAGQFLVNVPLTVDQTTTTSNRTVTATVNGLSTTITIQVVPPRPATLALSPVVVKGGTKSVATLNIIGVAPAGGLTVNLASNNAAAQVPATVVVPEGTKTVNFDVTTTPVLNTVNAATITATANGQARTATLKIEAPRVTAFTFDASLIEGGNRVRARVKLDGPAPAGGLPVAITSSDTTAVANTTITVPAGQTEVAVLLATKPVFPDKTATVTATYQASSAQASVQVYAARMIGVSLDNIRVEPGETVTAYILMSSPASGNYPIQVTINGVTQSVPVTAGAMVVPYTFTVPNVAPGLYEVLFENDLCTISTYFEIIP